MTATWNCYCALCSCSLGGNSDLGSKEPRKLRRRRARVARRIYWESRGGSRHDETEDEEEEEKEERLRNMPETDSGTEQGDDSVRELTSYDPELLGSADLDWLHVIGGIGRHGSDSGAAASDTPRYFIADLDYDDCNFATISHSGDPDAPEEGSEVYCYHGPEGGLVVFPFHWSCLQVLCRAILGQTDYKDLDKKALYDAMSSGKTLGSISLPFGDITGNDQDWQCVPGEEYSVTNPLCTSALDLQEVERFCEATNDTVKERPDLKSKVQNDPFKSLPHEITDMIMDNLPGQSLVALLGASWTMYARTQYSEFWKRRLYRKMPWIWELREFLELREDSTIDYKGLYVFLDEVTAPKYGIRTWLALANRRRIWDACEVLAKRYHRVKQGKIVEPVD